MIICILQLTLNMLLSLIEAYTPNLKLTYCELALVAKSLIIILHVCQHVYPLTITRDVENTKICA